MKDNYLSIYFFSQKLPLHRLLTLFIKPLLADLQRKYSFRFFFIRYWEGGPHIRLRVLPDDQGKKEEMSIYIRNSFRLFCSNLSEKTDGFDYRELDYVPEYKRYGGKYSMDISEKHFHMSSCTVLELLNGEEPYGSLLAKALVQHILFLRVLADMGYTIRPLLIHTMQSWVGSAMTYKKAGEDVMERFRLSYLPQKELLTDLLSLYWQLGSKGTEDDSYPVYKNWYEENIRLLGDFFLLKEKGLIDPHSTRSADMLVDIFSSLIHMTNNRIGILNRDESYMAFIILQFLESYDNKNFPG